MIYRDKYGQGLGTLSSGVRLGDPAALPIPFQRPGRSGVSSLWMPMQDDLGSPAPWMIWAGLKGSGTGDQFESHNDEIAALNDAYGMSPPLYAWGSYHTLALIMRTSPGGDVEIPTRGAFSAHEHFVDANWFPAMCFWDWAMATSDAAGLDIPGMGAGDWTNPIALPDDPEQVALVDVTMKGGFVCRCNPWLRAGYIVRLEGDPPDVSDWGAFGRAFTHLVQAFIAALQYNYVAAGQQLYAQEQTYAQFDQTVDDAKSAAVKLGESIRVAGQYYVAHPLRFYGGDGKQLPQLRPSAAARLRMTSSTPAPATLASGNYWSVLALAGLLAGLALL